MSVAVPSRKRKVASSAAAIAVPAAAAAAIAATANVTPPPRRLELAVNGVLYSVFFAPGQTSCRITTQMTAAGIKQRKEDKEEVEPPREYDDLDISDLLKSHEEEEEDESDDGNSTFGDLQNYVSDMFGDYAGTGEFVMDLLTIWFRQVHAERGSAVHRQNKAKKQRTISSVPYIHGRRFTIDGHILRGPSGTDVEARVETQGGSGWAFPSYPFLRQCEKAYVQKRSVPALKAWATRRRRLQQQQQSTAAAITSGTAVAAAAACAGANNRIR